MSSSTSSFLEDLRWRGLVSDCTNEAALAERLSTGAITLYCGFDPTAQSLHVGNLIPLLGLARFQRAGHKVLALTGGATGLIGDPSGKSVERNLQSAQDVAARTEKIEQQLKQFVDTSSPAKGEVVNNLEWTQNLSVLDFLRDTGKHFSVNAMIARDSVRSRIERAGDGISFTEFSYMLLQAQDFLKLFESRNCVLQIGGSDQWGNMCSGADLIRRKHGQEAFSLTFPLLTTSDGQKFGKTVKGAVWLDASLTSPWEFFQFWMNTSDEDVIKFLKFFTFLPKDEILSLESKTALTPQVREAQHRLAWELTALVHGSSVADSCRQAAGGLFQGASLQDFTADSWHMLSTALTPFAVGGAELPISVADLLVRAGLETSKTKANEAIKSGAVQVNGVKQAAGGPMIDEDTPLQGSWLLVKKGKKSFALGKVG